MLSRVSSACAPFSFRVGGRRAGVVRPRSLASLPSSGAARGAAPGGAAGTARHSALLAAIKQVEAAFGKGSLMQLGARGAALPNVEVVSTGSLALDAALGIGGLPRGRIVEIYGPESSGKTTLALQVVAEAQRAGLTCFFCDAEHAIDPAYARNLGIDLDALYLSQPDSGEQALEIVDTMVRSGGVDLVVVDSVAALVPKAELEGEMGDSHMALQARLMSQALRKLTASLSRGKCMIIFINQIRSKVGVVFGSPDITTGGNALKFYASIRLEIRRTGQVKGKGENEVVGNLVRVKVAKNKLAPPFRVADFEMTYGAGVSRAGEVVDLGVAFGVLARSGAWYSFANADAVAGTNAALSGAAAPAPVGAAAAALPSRASDVLLAVGKKKGAKQQRADDAAAAAAAAAADDAPPEAPPSVGAGVGGTESVELGTPFAQGRDRAKAWFEARPAALAAVSAVLRVAMKRTPIPAGTHLAAEGTASVGVIAPTLRGPVVDEEEALFGADPSAAPATGAPP